MDKYSVMLMKRAQRDLDGIYTYIARSFSEPGTALALVERIEKQILSLDQCRTAARNVQGEPMLTGDTESWL